MGLFRKTINPYKCYSIKEVMEILGKPEFKGYTSIERTEGRYSVITVEESRQLENRIKERNKEKKYESKC